MRHGDDLFGRGNGTEGIRYVGKGNQLDLRVQSVAYSSKQ